MMKPETRNQKPEATVSRLRDARRRRGGFAFTEVLFAVMVLGIGFIMIAAMFPVTIRQTQNTMQDTHGANLAKGALAYLQSIASNANFPVTSGGSPIVLSLPQALRPAAATGAAPGILEARGNFIDPNNPRLAWVPLYRRGKAADGTPEPFAQVIIIAVQSRNRPQYSSTPQAGNWSDLLPWDGYPISWGLNPKSSFPTSTLEPTPTLVTVRYNTTTLGGEITFTGLVTPSPKPTYPTAPGAYVVIADDQSAGALRGHSNGRIYQLGNVIDESKQIWSLAPGADMVVHTPGVASDDNDIAVPSPAYIIGRGYTDMTQAFNDNNVATGYSGPAQDIAVYTGFIQISR